MVEVRAIGETMNKIHITDEEVRVLLACLRTQKQIVDNIDVGDFVDEADLYSTLEKLDDAVMTQTEIYESDMLAEITE